MKFNLKKPCSDCPFRKDVTGFLGEARTKDITDVLKNDGTFACHKTTGLKTGKKVPAIKHSHCAGAMLLLEKEQGINSNLPLRLAIAFGWLQVDALQGADLIFDTFQEMINHHKL